MVLGPPWWRWDVRLVEGWAVARAGGRECCQPEDLTSDEPEYKITGGSVGVLRGPAAA